MPLHAGLVHLPLGLVFLLPLLALGVLFAISRAWLPRSAWVGVVLISALTLGVAVTAKQAGEQEADRLAAALPTAALDAHAKAADFFIGALAVMTLLAGALLFVRRELPFRLGVAAVSVAYFAVLGIGFRTARLGGELVYVHHAAMAPGAPATADQTAYAFGALVGRNAPLRQAGLSEAELAAAVKGFTDVALGRPLEADPRDLQKQIDAMLLAKREARAEEGRVKARQFLATAETLPGALKLPSGLIVYELKAGAGPTPQPDDTIRVTYAATLADGTRFDGTNGAPTELNLTKVALPCWTEGVKRLKVGASVRWVCPPELAYGAAGLLPSVPPNAVLVFDVELHAIVGK